MQTFKSKGLLRDNIHTSAKEQVAMFLHVAGYNQRFRFIPNTFRGSMKTISWYFRQVLYANSEER